MAFKAAKSATTYANAALAKAAQVEGGTIAQAGNLDVTEATGDPTRPIKNKLALADMNADDDSDSLGQGSRVVSNDGTGASTTDRAGVAKAVSGGTLAYNAGATEWVMHGGNVSATLGGVANTTLASAASDVSVNRGTENIKIQDRVLGSGELLDINPLARPSTEIHPERTKSADVGDRLTFVNSDDGTDAVESEIASSRSVPGRLTYRFGGSTPKKDVYKDKETYES